MDAIRRKSERRIGRLASELVRGPSEEKEAILAELELEQWVVETCEVCLD